MAKKSARKRLAFISVFDKTGLEPLAKAMVESYGYELLATGGTRTFLADKGLPVRDSSEITGFEDLLGGRVKSLHPEIFGAILAERDKPDHKTSFSIDAVIVNLYPFEQEVNSDAAKKDERHPLHFIDIGGSSLIRAAAKNHPFVNVLCDPAQYERFLQEMKLNSGDTSANFREYLAKEAFRRSMNYDAAIFSYFDHKHVGDNEPLAETLVLPLEKIRDLRYGENPHQKAALYGLGTTSVNFQQFQGKELSYNNILDMEAAWHIVSEFSEEPACAIIKHNNPCGVAISKKSIQDAYHQAFDADPLSAFGGVVGLNQSMSKELAEELKDVFLELIIAPDFDDEALEVLSGKKNLRLIQRPLGDVSTLSQLEFKQVSDQLFLLQQVDSTQETRIETLLDKEHLQIATKKKPTAQQMSDMIFAWKVVKHSKSNAIVIAKDGKTVGIGAGQTSRIGALENALKNACEEAKDAVLASDGFLPMEDNIYAAVQARVGAIIQPGGSIKDKEIIALANQYEMPMVTTGIREFKH